MVRRLLNQYGAFALLCHLLIFHCNASGTRPELGMTFTRNPVPLVAPLGDASDFQCSLNLAADKFGWQHRPLNTSQWQILTNFTNNPGRTSKFDLTVDDESKAGDYRCIAYYGTSGLASNPGRLTVAKIDRFQDKSDIEIIVPAGNTIPITCPVPYSSPEAIIQFYKDNIPVKNGYIANGKSLIIENAKPTDSGYYHCSAENYILQDVYRSNFKTKLNVTNDGKQVAPFFVKQPQTEYKVLRGGNITLECIAVAYPVPKVVWSRLVGELPLSSKYTNTGLNINNVQPADRGEYHCVWTSGKRKIESIIILKVAESPRVIKSPKSGTFSESGELELYCNTTGIPEPTIEWLINGEVLEKSSSVEMKGTTLFVSPVEKKHAGIVQCVASNEYGTDSGCNLLRVNPKQHPGGSTNSRVDMHHGFSGVSVRQGHKQIRNGGRRKNKDNQKTKIFLVPPNQPNVTRLSDISAMVRWSVPKNTGLPIQFFKVQYRELGDSRNNGKSSKWNTANSEIQSHITSFEVTELQPDHTYRFRIAAVYSNNDNQLSPNSARFHLTRMTGFDTNKMPTPLLTNTEALGPDQVLLIWQNSDHTVDIYGFYVYYRASTTAGEYIKTTVEGKNATNITISHLQPDTTYEFKVQSFSVDAASDFSKIIVQKTMKMVTTPSTIQEVLSVDGAKTSGTGTAGNVYAIVGGALGGATLLAALGAVFLIYKKKLLKQNQETSQNEGKLMTNGRVLNGAGGIADSKINITSNPLAVIDTSETAIQPKSGQQTLMEMTSFINGSSNNTNGNDDPAGSCTGGAGSGSCPR